MNVKGLMYSADFALIEENKDMLCVVVRPFVKICKRRELDVNISKRSDC